MSKSRLAIIAATGTGLKRTIPALAASKVCDVVAIQGRNQAKLEAAAAKFHIPHYYIDATEMLSREQLDAVFIASPPFLHLRDIQLVAHFHLPIICEKPLATSLQDAHEIAKLITASALPFSLAHHLRHQDAMRHLSDLLASRAIGSPLTAWLQWSFPLNSEAPNAKWKLDPSLGGDTAFHDAGVHLIDLALFLFGRPKKVYATGFGAGLAKYDNVTAVLEYDDLTVVLNASQTMKLPSNDVVIFGPDGRIEIPHGIGERSVEEIVVITKDGLQRIPFPPTNLYQNEVESFLLAKPVGSGSGTTLEEAMSGMEILQAITDSLSTSRSREL